MKLDDCKCSNTLSNKQSWEHCYLCSHSPCSRASAGSGIASSTEARANLARSRLPSSVLMWVMSACVCGQSPALVAPATRRRTRVQVEELHDADVVLQSNDDKVKVTSDQRRGATSAATSSSGGGSTTNHVVLVGPALTSLNMGSLSGKVLRTLPSWTSSAQTCSPMVGATC